LRRWQVSRLSQAAFCRQRKIPAWKFTCRKKRLQEASCGRLNRQGMAPGDLFTHNRRLSVIISNFDPFARAPREVIEVNRDNIGLLKRASAGKVSFQQ